MRTTPTARHTRVLVPLVTLSLLGLGLQASSSLAAAPAHCDAPTVSHVSGGDASNTLLGGTVIKYTVSCTGNDVVSETIEATYGPTTVFKGVASKLVSGQLQESIEIHLPAEVQQVCVTHTSSEEGSEPQRTCVT